MMDSTSGSKTQAALDGPRGSLVAAANIFLGGNWSVSGGQIVAGGGGNIVAGTPKGSCPVAISYTMTPSAKMSLRGSERLPSTCSGEMYGADPAAKRFSSACRSGRRAWWAKPKSISEENTFDHDTRDAAQIEKLLTDMSEGVSRALQHEEFIARTVVLKLRYSDFTTVTRQTTLRAPTADATEIRASALRLLRAHWDRRRALRLVGVGAQNLIEAGSARQMELLL